ncbi:MAG: DUF4233 domain-containing protein [Actinomycetota bacterium]
MRALMFYGVPGKMTRRLAGVVIGTQGLAVFFGALVARALAAVNGSSTSSTFLIIGSLLAVICILDAGLLRRPWGVTVGWVLQLATLACAFIVPAMLPVGLLFGALWLTALVQGRTMDEHTRRVDAQWYAAERSAANEPPGDEPLAGEASENLPSPHDG